MDLMYIENYSILMDIQIILMTLKTMLFPPKSNASAEKGVIIRDKSVRKEDKNK